MGDTSPGPGMRGPFGELKPLAAALTLGFGLSLAPTTYAATITVTSLADSGSGSLREAIGVANLNPGPDTINFTVAGPITLTTGELTISDDVTITGPGVTVVPTGTARAFHIDNSNPTNPNPTVTISEITIHRTSGTTTGNGGAIYNYGGTLTIQDSVISGNQASGKGGAIFNYSGTVNIVNSQLTGNYAAAGGAIYNEEGGVHITASTLSGNTATEGGAIFQHNGGLYIVSSTLSGNQATAGRGGALYAYNGSVTIQNSTFSGNTASADGGGVWSKYASVTISNSTFSGNVATGGGGAVALYSGRSPYHATLNLVSTILANSTDSGGTRDLFVSFYGGEKAKASKLGGHHHAHGIHKAMTTRTHRSGKAKPAKGPHILAGVTTVNATNSLIENDGGFINGTNVNNILGQDPVLGPLADNGGDTRTHALLAGSPAIDKGSNPDALAFDQRGSQLNPQFVRTVGAQTDIGAFEVQAPAPPPLVPTIVPTLSQWGTAILSGLLGIWAAVTGFGRRRRSGGS